VGNPIRKKDSLPSFVRKLKQSSFARIARQNLGGAQRDQMAPLVRKTAHLRTIAAAHIALQLVDRRRLWTPDDVERDRLVRVAAEATNLGTGGNLRLIRSSKSAFAKLCSTKLPTIPRTYSLGSAKVCKMSVMRASGFIAGGLSWTAHVAFMSRVVAAIPCNSLKQEGNGCDMRRHELDEQKSEKWLILLAIPAGLEPATRGVEIRYSIRWISQEHW
jgi:hypothetical protein